MSEMHNVEKISRKLRFPPKMGGNKEVVTLPCSFVSRLILFAEIASQSDDKAIQQELIHLDNQAGSIIEHGVNITSPR